MPNSCESPSDSAASSAVSRRSASAARPGTMPTGVLINDLHRVQRRKLQLSNGTNQSLHIMPTVAHQRDCIHRVCRVRDGEYQPESGKTTCPACVPGRFSQTGHEIRLSCPAGLQLRNLHRHARSATRNVCNAGYERLPRLPTPHSLGRASHGLSACYCTAPYWRDEGDCKPCPPQLFALTTAPDRPRPPAIEGALAYGARR